MKKLLLTTLAVAILATCSLAQSSNEELDLIQAALGMEKKAAFAEFIKVEGAQADAFWKLYDEFEVKRKELGKKRIALLQKYANQYENISEAETAEILKETIALGKSNDNLIATYANKMKKPAGIKAATQFYQLESYILSVVRASILESIPFIGEFDK
ncbi:MAG: hypothetical protein JNL53_17735 [Cyclobacteriaceae bacterium]|nr:hypothetical protein [Cyclobacteriaceae bacterium]